MYVYATDHAASVWEEVPPLRTNSSHRNLILWSIDSINAQVYVLDTSEFDRRITSQHLSPGLSGT